MTGRLALPPAILPPLLVLLGLLSVAHRVSMAPEVAPIAGLGLVSVIVATAAMLALLAALEESVPLRRVVSASLLVTLAGVLLARLGGFSHPTWFAPHPSWHQAPDPFIWALLIVTGLALGGLLVRRPWARWLGVGLGVAGTMLAGFEILEAWRVPDGRLWLASVQAAGCLLLIATLGSPDVAQMDASEETNWRSPSPAIRWTKAAIVASIAAAPVLLSHAWFQSARIASLEWPSILLAVVLVVGTVASLRGKSVGVLLLVAAGCGLLALTIAIAIAGTTDFDHRLALFHAALWLPAIICSFGAGLALAYAHARSGERVTP
jgi:hypothetical protein